MSAGVTFILADNQDITREGLRSFIIRAVHGCNIVEASCKKDLIWEMDKCGAGVVILDYTLFDLRSVEDFLVIHKRFPDINWVMFSSDLSEDFIRRVCVEENVGMVLKDNSGEEIRSAIICAARGERFLCHQVSNLMLMSPSKSRLHHILTPSEIEILKLICRGMSVKEMAAERVSSIHTIITHKKNIFRKLEVNNVYEATKYALRAGLVDMIDYYI